MADNLSQDDFEQKLRELGYLPSAEKEQLSSPAVPPTPVQAEVPAEEPTPVDREGQEEERIRAQDSEFQTKFPDISNSVKAVPPVEANIPPAISEPMGSEQTQSGQVLSDAAMEAESKQNPLVANPEINDEAMANAQEGARLRNLITGIGHAGAGFAAGAIGDKTDENFFNQQYKQADQPVTDIKDRREAFMKNQTLASTLVDSQIKKLTLEDAKAATDPSSDVSKTARGLYQMVHPGIEKTEGFNNMSAKDLKDFGQHLIEFSGKLEAQKVRNAQVDEIKNKAQAEKQEQQHNKDFMKFSDKVQGSLASSRGDFGKNANVIRSAGAIEQLINQAKEQPGGVDSRQYYEVARAMDAMLSSGQGTIGGTKELLPHTSGRQFASVKEWLTNKPSPADLQDFLKRAEDTVKREKNYALKRNSEIVAKIAPGYSHLKNVDVDKWNTILRTQGLETDDEGNITGVKPVDGHVGEQPKSQNAAPAMGPDVLDYAKKHNITPEQALAIKQKRMGK